MFLNSRRKLFYIITIYLVLHTSFFNCSCWNILGLSFLLPDKYLQCSLQCESPGNEFLKIFPENVFHFCFLGHSGYRILGWHLSFHSVYVDYLKASQVFVFVLRNLLLFFEIFCYLSVSPTACSNCPCVFCCCTLSPHTVSFFFFLCEFLGFLYVWMGIFPCSVCSHSSYISSASFFSFSL